MNMYFLQMAIFNERGELYRHGIPPEEGNYFITK
jgi:hypothetical protein